MEDRHIETIITFLKETGSIELIETHISWVILTPAYAYKIKKPVKYSFLDFSTLAKRKYYCHREVQLNRRLAGDMYLGVVAIRRFEDALTIDAEEGEIIDYAVKMKHIDRSKQMDVLLADNKVTIKHMDQVADVLSTFHVYTDMMEEKPVMATIHEDYADILAPGPESVVYRFLNDTLGTESVGLIQESIDFTASFLKVFAGRFEERARLGFVIDGHGDLHSKNIFLLDEPLIFDCIEFNNHFRHLDVLDELAFFCMDLELFDRTDLAQRLIQSYEVQYPCILDEADVKIFQYYKLYRSNVKIKVNALKAIQAGQQEIQSHRSTLVGNYYDLFQRYFQDLKS